MVDKSESIIAMDIYLIRSNKGYCQVNELVLLEDQRIESKAVNITKLFLHMVTIFQVKNLKYIDWTDGSGVKSVFYFSRGPEFNSQPSWIVQNCM